MEDSWEGDLLLRDHSPAMDGTLQSSSGTKRVLILDEFALAERGAGASVPMFVRDAGLVLFPGGWHAVVAMVHRSVAKDLLGTSGAVCRECRPDECVASSGGKNAQRACVCCGSPGV